MPKKYEHIIRCRLSKRQRFLYEEYMSRTRHVSTVCFIRSVHLCLYCRTKETLATGDFLSVINILMQLRKVWTILNSYCCNVSIVIFVGVQSS